VVDFFISYTAADRGWAEWIAWQLQDAGYTVVLQAWDFVPGRDFLHEMERATSSAHRTITVLSGDYAESAFGEAEWRVAFAKDPSGEKGLLVPVKVAPCTPPSLLASRVYIDLTGKAALEARDALLAGIDGEGMRPTSEPAFPGQRTHPPMFPGDTGPRHELLQPQASGRIRFPGGRTAIYFSENPVRGAAVATDRYDTLQELLDDIYISYLRDQFPPFTYGDKWVLASRARCIAPLSWVSAAGSRIFTIEREWQRISPSDAGIHINQALYVANPEDIRVFGVVAGNPETLSLLERNKKAIYYLSRRRVSILSPQKALNSEGYKAVFHVSYLYGEYILGKVVDLRGSEGAELVDRFT